MNKTIKDLEMEVAFAQRQIDLLGTSRQRMMKRTVQTSMQRDKLLDAVRDAVACKDLGPLQQLLNEVDAAVGLWAPQTGTDRATTYRDAGQ